MCLFISLLAFHLILQRILQLILQLITTYYNSPVYWMLGLHIRLCNPSPAFNVLSSKVAVNSTLYNFKHLFQTHFIYPFHIFVELAEWQLSCYKLYSMFSSICLDIIVFWSIDICLIRKEHISRRYRFESSVKILVAPSVVWLKLYRCLGIYLTVV